MVCLFFGQLNVVRSIVIFGFASRESTRHIATVAPSGKGDTGLLELEGSGFEGIRIISLHIQANGWIGV